MRFSVAAVAGIAAFGSDFGAYARAVPNSLNGVSARLVGAPIKPVTPVIPKPVEPAKPVKPGENNVPEIVVPETVTPEVIVPENATPEGTTPEVALKPVEPLAEVRVPPVPEKVSVDPVIKAPTVGAPKKAEAETNPQVQDENSSFDIHDLKSTSDLKASPKNCKAAKREISIAQRLSAEWKRVIALKQRSGDETALSWDTWKKIFGDHDTLLKANTAVTEKVVIYVFGGISSLSMGARGADGKTGDADFMYDPKTKNTHKNAMGDAISSVYGENQGTIPADYMNSAVGMIFQDAAKFQKVVDGSKDVAWEGDKLKVVNAHYGVQLVRKMNRIADARKEGAEYKNKDLQDAAGFLDKISNELGRKVNMADMQKFSDLGNVDRKHVIVYTADMLQEATALFDPDVMKASLSAKETWFSCF